MNSSKDEKFRIVAVTYLDFLGFSEMSRTDLKKMVVIKGDNTLGKTSFIKGIRACLKKSDKKNDGELVKIGKPAAKIMMSLKNLSDTKLLEISRTITADSNNLKVVEDGRPVGTAQTRLNEIVGDSGLYFNPIEFFIQDKASRRNMILKAIEFKLTPDMVSGPLRESGADPSVIEFDNFNFDKHGLILLAEIRKAVYDTRTEQGRRLDQLKKSILQDEKEIPDTFDVEKFSDFNISEKLSELRKLEGQIAWKNKMISQKENLNSRIEKIEAEQDEINAEIGRLQQKLEAIKSEAASLVEQIESINNEILEFREPNIAALQAEIEEYNNSQKLITKIEAIKKRKADITPEREKHERLDLVCNLLAKDIPRQILESVKLPIEGLSVEGDDVFLNGIPIDQLSTKEQIIFANQLAQSFAGPLKAICIDGIESLSNKNYEIFMESCANDDFQYFITKVTDDAELTIESEDGK